MPRNRWIGSFACIPILALCPSTPAPPAPAPEPVLALGITERSPSLIGTTGDSALAAGRGNIAALKPRYVRVMVNWAEAQPKKDKPPNWDRHVRQELEAIGRRQKAEGKGWRVMVVPYFTPAWAALDKRGCERAGTKARARMPKVAAYRSMLRSLQQLGKDTGVELDWWSPWNEPNHPAFLNPQRETCELTSPPQAPKLYARLARVMKSELKAGQKLVVGELAGLEEPRVYGAGAEEFTDALPPETACAGEVFGQHAYVGKAGKRLKGGGRAAPAIVDPAAAPSLPLIDGVTTALYAKGCSPKLWMTETGSFDHRCEGMAAALKAWSLDGRITAAFQYTYREDPNYPTGLADQHLTKTYGSYDAWRTAARLGAEHAPEGC